MLTCDAEDRREGQVPFGCSRVLSAGGGVAATAGEFLSVQPPASRVLGGICRSGSSIFLFGGLRSARSRTQKLTKSLDGPEAWPPRMAYRTSWTCGLSRESCSPCHGQRVGEARTAIGITDFMAAPRHEKAGAKHPRS